MSTESVSLPRRIVRGARRALHRSALGAWLERRDQLKAARSWTDDDDARRGFYAALVGPGDLVFDVGANVGNRTKVFLRLGARVVAVEPQPACASLLDEAFGDDPLVTVVREALGAAPGEAEMRVSDASTISSMSVNWIEAVRSSGRFAAYRWNRTIAVPVTTLDALIARFGAPVFVKIDVEGFELAVLQGLSRPVRCVSFEFTPECADAGLACVARLESLGFARFNYSAGESVCFESTEWIGASAVRARLESLRGDVHTFGDVYARADVP